MNKMSTCCILILKIEHQYINFISYNKIVMDTDNKSNSPETVPKENSKNDNISSLTKEECRTAQKEGVEYLLSNFPSLYDPFD